MTDYEKSTLWIGAFRYYCGRMTYAVSDFVDLLVQEWPNLPEHAHAIIKRDLDEEFRLDDAARAGAHNGRTLGHDCDREQWERVRNLWRPA